MCELESFLDILTTPSQLTSLSTDLDKPRYLATLNINIVSEAMSVREQSAGLSKSRFLFGLLKCLASKVLTLKHFKAGVRQLRKLLDKVSRKAKGGWNNSGKEIHSLPDCTAETA